MQPEPPFDPSTSPVSAWHVTIIGRVQGVNFRASLHTLAERHGVTGWVTNRPEGTVEAWLEGSSADVDALLRWVRDGGPAAAEVVDLHVREREPAGYERFDVRP